MWTLPPDAEFLPSTGESPETLWLRSLALPGSDAEPYLATRRVPLAVAEAAGVRFTPDLKGRPAVLARLTGPIGEFRSVHGRYLHVCRGEGKMFTIGRSGGAYISPGGLEADPLVLVEGLFDALSLAAAGLPSVATIGRWVDWLPARIERREVWLAFDSNRPGDRWAREWAAQLPEARTFRLRPPGGRGDWNAAARRIGACDLERWIRRDAGKQLEGLA